MLEAAFDATKCSQYTTPQGIIVRSRTRADLVSECVRILSCDSWDDNSVMNAADRLADLLFELTRNTGLVRVDAQIESFDERQKRIWM